MQAGPGRPAMSKMASGAEKAPPGSLGLANPGDGAAGMLPKGGAGQALMTTPLD